MHGGLQKKPQPQAYSISDSDNVTFSLTSMLLAIDPLSNFTVLFGAEKLVFHGVGEFGLRKPRGNAVPMVRKGVKKRASR